MIVVDQNPYMLPRLPYALLLALAEAYPAGVGREDLYAALWADIIVEPGQSGHRLVSHSDYTFVEALRQPLCVDTDSHIF